MNKENKEKLRNLILDFIETYNKRFKQELLGDNEEFLDRTIRNYRSKISRISWKKAQSWCKWEEDGPVLMPDNTRIYYKKGDTEVVLQEFQPQIRLMKFKGGLVSKKNSTDNVKEEEVSKSYHYSLALPYVVFIFKFINGVFIEVKCMFSDRPLKKLDEKPFKPYFSNIDTTLAVCLGQSFDKSQLIKDDIYQQVALVLNHFWHSAYNDEWSYHYWNYKSYFEKYDKRLADLNSWQNSSIDNPLFVIEDVNWLEHTEENFGDIIVKMFEGDKKDNTFQEEMYKDLIELFLDDITNTFKENIDAVDNDKMEIIAEKLVDKLLENLGDIE